MMKYLGPNADWLERLRASVLPPLDAVLERKFGGPGSAYRLGPGEHAAAVSVSPEVVEERLWELGLRRNPLAASKTVADGRREVGSWAYRGELVADRRQIHIILFQRADGGTDIYAHREFSSAIKWLYRDRSVLRRHYRGVGYSAAEGKAFVRKYVVPAIESR